MKYHSWHLCLTSLQIMLLPIQIVGKSGNWTLCCAILVWNRTCDFKLNSSCAFVQFWNHVNDFRTNCTDLDMCWIHLEENHVPVFCTYNRFIRYTFIFWLHSWKTEDSDGENKKNLVHFCSILIVSNSTWPLIMPKNVLIGVN